MKHPGIGGGLRVRRHPAKRRTRLTEEEVRAAVRAQGLPAIEKVEAVALETDGSLSVIGRGDGRQSSSLAGISMPHQASSQR
jgi:uncharacterized membrane protein YcaP (DUF421 family)